MAGFAADGTCEAVDPPGRGSLRSVEAVNDVTSGGFRRGRDLDGLRERSRAPGSKLQSTVHVERAELDRPTR